MGNVSKRIINGIYRIYPFAYRIFCPEKAKDEKLSSPDSIKPWAWAGNWAIVNPLGSPRELQGKKLHI